MPRPVRLVAVAIAAAAVLAGCHKTKVAVLTPTTPAPASVSTSTVKTRPAPPRTTPPTTAHVPSDPQSSAEDAASVFMNAWIAGNRSQSASVATASAVATLFAHPYAGQPLNDRGCTDSFPPLVCTWGPYAGGSGSIYEVTVAQTGSRWYVSSVVVES